MEVEGVVEAISVRKKGIKINNKWYNIPEELLSKVSKGYKIRAEIDNFGNITNIDILDTTPLDIETKVKTLEIALEVIKLTFQYGQPPLEFKTASQSKTIEDEVNKFLELLLKTQRKIEEWLK